MSIHEEEARLREVFDAHPGLLWWVARGDRGMSSASLLYVLTGAALHDARRDDLPLDSGDLKRCIALLDAVPTLRALLPGLAAKGGPGWPGLASVWATLEALLKAREIKAVRSMLERAARGSQCPFHEVVDAHPGLLAWLCTEARKPCTLAMAYHLTGVHLIDVQLDETPYDAGEAAACAEMLDAAPTLRALLPRLADADVPAWQVLGRRWTAIEAALSAGDYDAADGLLP